MIQRVALLIGFWTLLTPALSFAAAPLDDTPCKPYPAEKRFRWQLRGEVGIADLVAALVTVGCQRIMVPQAIAQRAGKISLDVPDLITADEAWRIFHAGLEASGLTVEKSGKLWKIVDLGRAKEISRILAPSDDTPVGEQIVTRLVRPVHARAAELAEVLTKLKGKDGDVSALASSGALLLTDRATTVHRMESLLGALDVPRAPSLDRYFAFPTRMQSPTELVTALEKILSSGAKRSDADPKGAAPSAAPLAEGVSALVAVDTARLIVLIGQETGFQRVSQLLDRLDPASAVDASGRAHVLYLAHTNAEDIVATLSTVGVSGRGGPGASASPRGGTSGGSQGAAAFASGDLKVGADKVSNSLVIFGNAADYEVVRSLVARLDVPRRQVFVEAIVLDLSVDKTRDLGLSFHQGGQVNGASGFYSSSSTSNSSAIAGINAQSLATMLASGGLLGGIFGPSFNIAGTSVPSFGVVVKALERSKDVNVISRPHLITSDNVKASLSVGQKIPFRTADATGASAATALVSTYQRMDVALKLDITPHLNDSDSVRLEIESEIADVPDGQSAASPGGPTTNNRTLKTNVVVRDGEPIVLGGLQKEQESEIIEKIPGLGSIPVLGRLFQTRSKQRTKQDLLIILTPYVIRGPDDFRRIYERKTDERRELIERFTQFKIDSSSEPKIDYSRRRGLLEEINVTARAAQFDADARRAAELELSRRQTAGPITTTSTTTP